MRTWLKQAGAPVHRREGAHRSLFDPYASYVLDRWQAGVRDGKQLYAEIQQLGFAGSLRLVYTFLQTLRDTRRPYTAVVPSSPAERFSAHHAVWLFIRDPNTLTAREQEQLALIRAASAEAEAAYALVRDFLTMVHQREGARLDSWIQAVQVSQIPELLQFVTGILKDKDAVVAGLTLTYSNGPVEAQVQKLKLVKRSMHGRAKFPLLRQRLLHPV